MWFLILFSCGLCLSVLGIPIGHVPQVAIAQGVVSGLKAPDGGYFEFHGIPYADSTSGSNRFKAPSPPPTFDDIFVANRKDVKCIRAIGNGYEGTEDCLVANIFTPTLNTTKHLPVMIWIRGNELSEVINLPRLSFRNFMEQDVIVVSLNYRQSIFGFLCLGTETAPGNAGMKDIIAGLKWVRENIVNFGGDPENISLFGHGSGAAAVDLVSLSPMAEGLFHKAITQSGSALSPWAVTRDNIKYALAVAEALGHQINNVEQLSEVFTKTSVAALMAVINELDLTDNSMAFAPCVEKENLVGSEPFLHKSPYKIIIEGDYYSVPLMTGFVDKEGTIRAEKTLRDDWLQKMDESFADFIQSDLLFENKEEEITIVNKIKHFYFGDQVIDRSKVNEYISYHGDTMILLGILRETRLRALSCTHSIYLYQFSYKGPLGDPFVGDLSVEKAAHSEELGYLFRDYNIETNEVDLTISDILIERWTNFARTGVPFSETSQMLWRPYTSDNSYFLRILDSDEVNKEQGGSLEIELENPYPETMLFWEEIYEEHFLDAKGRWDIIDRVEEESDEIINEDDGSGEQESSGEGESNEEDENSDEEEAGGDEESGEDDNNDGNSATTAVRYTSLIVILFSILDKLHVLHLIS